MKDFTITLTQKEDGALHALLQSDGYQSAVEVPQINGDVNNDRAVICNLFRNLEQIFCERCFPDAAIKWQARQLPSGETAHFPPQ